ncbi:hypothetical protein JOF56_008043 [Kibdelosporangium banguiense]|uniref:Sulfotransferase family protein n=1 Tax=Kibdelosporangium banguiense TaxID=1365924 RepID=A0ABS4TTE9_9PSEU|nr:sulfotransferase family protein [Kibdelosporangium banguiense]MBP2327658.1 hypothetical protein [Kibdelosporangium banguiense]
MVQVIGAGFGRTGTASLKRALELLGFGPCHHMSEVLKQPQTTVGWTAALNGDRTALPPLLEGYKATVDFPGCLLWREMTELYPDAKVVLSVRDPKKWYDSARATILSTEPREMPQDIATLLRPFSEAMAARGFRRDLSEADTIEVFNRHNESVQAGVDPRKLLVYEVSQGWAPLCEFLDAEVPDTPFPRGNDSASFRENVNRLLKDGIDDFV